MTIFSFLEWCQGEPPKVDSNEMYLVRLSKSTLYPEGRFAIVWWWSSSDRWQWDDSESDFPGEIMCFASLGPVRLGLVGDPL